MGQRKPSATKTVPPLLRTLILEDNPLDAKLMVRALERGGFKVKLELTDSAEIFKDRLAKGDYDVILADFNLRGWNAFDALEILKQTGMDIPLIVATGSLGDEAAAECIKRGAADFILKDRPARLPTAVQRALQEKQLRTEKKRAEELLVAERNLLHTLMDNLPDVIYFKDRESRFLRINKALAHRFGLTDPAQALGKTDRDFFTAEHAQAAYEDEQEIIHTGTALVGEEEKETWADGSVTWALTTKMPRYDSGGNVVGTFGVSHDITGSKLAEESLQESEERYRSLFERNLAGVFCTSWDGRILDCNQAMAKIMGFASTQEALSHSVHELYASEEERAAFLARLQAEGRLNNYEMRLRHSNGSIVWLIGNISLLPQTSTGLRIIEGTLIDITERKLAEAENKRLAQIVNSSENAIFSATPEGVIATWNAGAERMYGYDAKEIIGKHFSILIPEDRRAALARVEETLLGGDAIAHYEQEDMRKDGSTLQVSLTLSPIKDAAGAVTGVSVISRDITAHKRAEEALRQSEEKYRSIVSNVPDVVWTLDSNFHFAFISRNIEKMSGFTIEEIDRRGTEPYIASLHPDDVPKVKGGLLALFEEGRPYDVEVRIRRKDGEWIWAHDRAVATYEKDGILFADGLLSDITERKRAEEALRESEERFRSLVQNATVGIYRTTPQGRIIMANPALIKMLGYSNFEELASRDLNAGGFEPGYSREAFRERIEREGEVRGLESAWTRAGGSMTYVQESARAVRGGSGEILYYDGIVEDITERKQTEGKMRASEIRYRRLFETAHDGILILDADSGEIRDVNPFLTELLGFSQAELLGKKLWEIGPLRDVLLSKIGFEELQTKGYIRYEDLPLQRRDGKNVAVEFVSNVYVAGHLKVIQCNIRDITERKRAEAEHARLVTAIEQSAEGVVITKANGEIEYVNPAFTRITGYSRGEALGQNPRILKSEKQDPVFYRQLWETILAGKPWSGELINQRKDKSLYTEQMSIAPIKDVYDEVTHFIATKQDVTERRTLEAQLHQAAKMEAVGRLAGGVAHDFNNLLTVINGYSEILLGRLASDERAGPYLQEIFNAGERAASLTRQLLAFSRRQVLAPQVLDLNAVVLNLEKMLRRLIGEDVKLRTNLDPHLERVKADPGQIEQVIMNLAVNARDAMPMGGNLTIETRNVELDESYAHNHPTVKPGPHVMLAVSDTGAGMTPQTQARIFEPFFTTKEIGKGTGLGLATVYGIVKQSEGSIWVYSEVGHGTAFKLYLPVVGESPMEVVPMNKAKDPASGTETILVVEDEDGVRSLVHVALASGGYLVLEAKDAESATAMCAEHAGPIHLLLTDVVMPQMSGPALAKKLTAIRHGIKVLFMSGYTDDAVVHHGVLSHDIPFIQKPFSPVALRKKIHEVLHGISSEEDTKS